MKVAIDMGKCPRCGAEELSVVDITGDEPLTPEERRSVVTYLEHLHAKRCKPVS